MYIFVANLTYAPPAIPYVSFINVVCLQKK